MGHVPSRADRGKPRRKRQRRRIRDSRHSQRQAPIHAFLLAPFRRLLRCRESQWRKQPDRDLFEPKVPRTFRSLPGKKQADEHDEEISYAETVGRSPTQARPGLEWGRSQIIDFSPGRYTISFPLSA